MPLHMAGHEETEARFLKRITLLEKPADDPNIPRHSASAKLKRSIFFA